MEIISSPSPFMLKRGEKIGDSEFGIYSPSTFENGRVLRQRIKSHEDDSAPSLKTVPQCGSCGNGQKRQRWSGGRRPLTSYIILMPTLFTK